MEACRLDHINKCIHHALKWLLPHPLPRFFLRRFQQCHVHVILRMSPIAQLDTVWASAGGTPLTISIKARRTLP